jgi:hypothetical protein
MGARPMQVMCLVVQMREHQRAHSDVALPSTRRCWPGCGVRSCFVRLAGRCAEPKAYGWRVSFSRRELDNLPKSADFGERAACQDSQLIRPCRRILRSNLVTINSGFESGGPGQGDGAGEPSAPSASQPPSSRSPAGVPGNLLERIPAVG